jgi:hypothetical protein
MREVVTAPVVKAGFECIWIDKDYSVAALVDEDETVQAFAVTARTTSLRPRFESAKGKAYPKLAVVLGEMRFSDLELRPTTVEAFVGANRYGYNEIFYLGRPGAYQHFVCGVNDAGPGWGATFDSSLWNLRHTPALEADKIFDESLSEFRRTSIVNTWIVLSDKLDPGDQRLLMWPDADVLTTVAR